MDNLPRTNRTMTAPPETSSEPNWMIWLETDDPYFNGVGGANIPTATN